MPTAASSSRSRRSVNTSRGRPRASDGLSSGDEREASTHANGQRVGTATIGDVEEEEDDDEDEEEDVEMHVNGASRGLSQDVRDALSEFDQLEHSLRPDVAETAMRTHAVHWDYLNENIKSTFEILTDTAERRADVLGADQRDGDNDMKLVGWDKLCRELIDMQAEAQVRRKALDDIRKAVKDGERITDAAEKYREIVYASLQVYNKKTQRQRYGTSKQYEQYRQRIWAGLHEEDDPMPPIIDLIPADEGEEEEEGDDIAVFGASNVEYKCPITLQIMTHPVRSTVCSHAFERDAIYNILGSATKPCPQCQKLLRKSSLVDDPDLAKACNTYRRRVERRRERERTQQQSAILD